MRDITLYLPLYKAVTIRELSLDPEAHLEQPTPYAIRKPIVYYGSSITQGGCDSNPGGSCQAILERRLNADFVNLGFSGNGLGEPVLAEAICELDPSWRRQCCGANRVEACHVNRVQGPPNTKGGNLAQKGSTNSSPASLP